MGIGAVAHHYPEQGHTNMLHRLVQHKRTEFSPAILNAVPGRLVKLPCLSIILIPFFFDLSFADQWEFRRLFI